MAFKNSGRLVGPDAVAIGSQDSQTSLWQKIVDYTTPREGTGGNYEKSSYFQALTQGGIEGFYLFGPTGVVTGAASSACAVAVQNKTSNRWLGVGAGVATGAALAAATAAVIGGPVGLATAALGGGLLGGLQTFRSDATGRMRDSAGGGTMLAGFFLHGPAKMASGIAGACGNLAHSKAAKAAIGAAVGLALGASLSLAGFAAGGLALTALGTAAAGAIGPFFGPVFSQTFRNFAQDVGRLGRKVTDKLHLTSEQKPGQERTSSAIGAIPAAFARELVRGGFMSDGSMSKMLIGSTVKAIQLAHMMYFARNPESKPDVASSPST